MTDVDDTGLVVRDDEPVVHVDEFEAQFKHDWRLAQALAASGIFKDVRQAEHAFGRILLGRDLGLSPTHSLMVLDVVEGNARVRSVQLAAWVRQHPKYDYQVTEHDESHCVIEFYYDGDNTGTSAFSIEEAKKAGLVKDHPKSSWRAWPKNMLWARAMSNGVRWYCPEVTGGIPVYTEADSFDEVPALTSGDGDGTDPGWKGLNETQISELEKMIERAAKLGSSYSNRAAVQYHVGGRSDEDVAEYLADADEILDNIEAQNKQEGSP
jgi:hypothetical protein